MSENKSDIVVRPLTDVQAQAYIAELDKAMGDIGGVESDALVMWNHETRRAVAGRVVGLDVYALESLKAPGKRVVGIGVRLMTADGQCNVSLVQGGMTRARSMFFDGYVPDMPWENVNAVKPRGDALGRAACFVYVTDVRDEKRSTARQEATFATFRCYLGPDKDAEHAAAALSIFAQQADFLCGITRNSDEPIPF